MDSTANPSRSLRVKQALAFAVALLLSKVFISIMWEYRWYFPANFDSAFLGGRRYTFDGIYCWAFYLHIVSGPVVIVLACISMLRVRVASLRKAHRLVGRIQVLITVLIMLPSGLIMAADAYGGPIAGLGFTSLVIATTVSVVATAFHARSRNFQSHQQWATRSFILLLSPLVLRLIAGVMIVTGLESQETYQMNAWISWILPLYAFEMWSWARRKYRLGGMVMLLPLVFCLGCNNHPTRGPIDTTGAEFSTADDYAAYDEEMIELASGQTE